VGAVRDVEVEGGRRRVTDGSSSDDGGEEVNKEVWVGEGATVGAKGVGSENEERVGAGNGVGESAATDGLSA